MIVLSNFLCKVTLKTDELCNDHSHKTFCFSRNFAKYQNCHEIMYECNYGSITIIIAIINFEKAPLLFYFLACHLP